MKKIIAITGGIGSGKSAVLRILSQMNYPIISADDVNRELLVDEDYLKELKKYFPDAFVEGRLDKKRLAGIIFNNDEQRLLLNSIAHVRIQEIIDKRISNIMSKYIFVEVPLLIESGMMQMFDEIIVVTASTETKINRVMKRDNTSREAVLSRMNVQLDDSELLKVATHVIENNSSFLDLEHSVEELIPQL